jgi:Raf kinase inhibitor-like YbhB/YbcL family protein
VLPALTLWLAASGAAAQSDQLRLSTAAFEPGAAFSWRYTCYNALEPSPPLDWSGIPPSAASLAVLLEAPQRPAGIDAHWLIFNIPADVVGLPEAEPKVERLGNGARQARNDFGNVGYGAPCPPLLTPFTYRFTLYVLDGPLDLPSDISADVFRQSIDGHVVDQVHIDGTYLRPAWPWG